MKIKLPNNKKQRLVWCIAIGIVILCLFPFWIFIAGGALTLWIFNKIHNPKIRYAITIPLVLFTIFIGSTFAASIINPSSSNPKNQTKIANNHTQVSKPKTQVSKTKKVSSTITNQENNTLNGGITTTPKTSGCHENNGLPDLACTPGARNPKVTQDNINSTICVSGYTATIRPSTSYTNNLKAQQIKAYGYSDTNMSSYEEDHFIALEIGGSPDSPSNLWPEPYSGTYGARVKDKIENYFHSQICNGRITLAEAQKETVQNWELVYNILYGSTNNKTPEPTVSSSPTSIPSSQSLSSTSSGATGLCNDGTYTYAIYHQGACSHHGGVSQWL